MNSFSAKIQKIGINPYVLVPKAILQSVFSQAGKTRGAVPIKGEVNGHLFIQTLVKYRARWRLYINGPMRKAAGVDVGDIIKVKIQFDDQPRVIETPHKLKAALEKNKKALAAFSALAPSRQKEIVRYIAHLKKEDAIERNIKRIVGSLSAS